MATTTTFLTMPIMRDAVVDSATSNSADAIANLIDFNLDTTWTPSSNSTQVIDIDTQKVSSPTPNSPISVSAIGVWIANNDIDFSVSSPDTGSGITLQGSFSHDDISYTGTAVNDYEPNGGNMF